MGLHHKNKQHGAQKQADKKAFAENRQHGSGLYVFKNALKNATLTLPKEAKDLKGNKITEIPIGGEFVGDDYFMMLVRQHECRLVSVLEEPKKENMNEEKLILDQPETVTQAGIVEQVVKKTEKKKLNEQPEEVGDVLLNDDPTSGIEILN